MSGQDNSRFLTTRQGHPVTDNQSICSARALPPLPGKPAPGQRRQGPTYASGRPEEPAGTRPGQQAAE